MNMKSVFSFSFLWCALLFLVVFLMSLNHVCCNEYKKAYYENSYDYDEAVQRKMNGISNKRQLPSLKLTTSETTTKNTFPEMINEILLSQRKRATGKNMKITSNLGRSANDPLVSACKNVKASNTNRLRCYHCYSDTKKDKEPRCDNRHWKYLKHSDKRKLRENCDLDAEYCGNMVQQKLGQRITTRGCYGRSLIGSNKITIKPQNECMVFNKNGYRNTFCTCDTDFCNSACITDGRVLSFGIVTLLHYFFILILF